jgi:serine/threonine protein kinase
MAPEVVMGRGYSASADYWSLGVLIYEMTCGFVPFGEDKEDPIEVYELILAHRLVYPENAPRLSKNIKALIQQLLNVNSAMRIAGGITNLRNHSFFSLFPWVRFTQDQLRCRELDPPHYPENLLDLDEARNQAISRMESLDSALSVRLHSAPRDGNPVSGKSKKHSDRLTVQWLRRGVLTLFS